MKFASQMVHKIYIKNYKNAV